MKIFSLLFIVLLFGCEFRPAGVYLNPYHENTKCIYPVLNVGYYDLNESYIIKCAYNSSHEIKKEYLFDANTLKLIGLILYSYKRTYYIKTIYDYELGSEDSNYIIDRYYVNR